MMPKGELIGISPEIIELSDAEVQEFNAPQVISSDTPTLKEACISVEAEKIITLFCSLAELAEQAGSKLSDLSKAIRSAWRDIECIVASPNSRVKHLAQYSKKRRVRKKNIARLKMQFEHEKGKRQSYKFALSEKKAPEDVWVIQNTQGECKNDSNNN